MWTRQRLGVKALFSLRAWQEKFWRIESQFADGTMVDLNRVIPSFPILSRLPASQS